MSKATICNSSGNALEQVLDPSTTLRYVRKPDMQPCCLKVKCAEDATLVVEIDGEKVATHALRAGSNKILLSLLVPRSKFMARLNALKLLNSGKSGNRNEPQEFTVFVRSGNEDGRLLSTYSFKLMSEQAFDHAFDQYVRRMESKPVEKETFTTDESAVDSVAKCWNCRQPIASNACCLECGCEPKDDPESNAR
jgi:hypothetical protein